MNKYCHYTPINLAKELIHLIPSEAHISTIIDISCGSWNLLKAAQYRYPQSTLVGVDIDQSSQQAQLPNSEFILGDGRDFSQHCRSTSRSFDLVLSNPPFGLLHQNDKKYGNENQLTNRKRYETEMLWANYCIMAPESWLLVIMPSTFIEGISFKKQREWTSSHLHLIAVIQLPDDTFDHATFHTYALLLQKSFDTHPYTTALYSAKHVDGDEWLISPRCSIDYSLILKGNWIDSTHHKHSDKVVDLFRGNISSHDFASEGIPVLHCSNSFQNTTWTPSTRLCSSNFLPNSKYALPGDIIINRVGKFAGYWAVYTGEACLVSDCIIVLRQPNRRILEFFERISINHRLPLTPRGVAVRYVTSADIVNLIESL